MSRAGITGTTYREMLFLANIYICIYTNIEIYLNTYTYYNESMCIHKNIEGLKEFLGGHRMVVRRQLARCHEFHVGHRMVVDYKLRRSHQFLQDQWID